MENWDLQAVLEGCSNDALFSAFDMDPSFTFDPLISIQQEELLSTGSALDELEELYKPFYPESNSNNIISTQTTIPDCQSLPQDVEKPEKLKRQQSRRSQKNQQNRVVQHVTADGLSSDVWAWRKYGQKPIKGSPYPRSYYRCSSLKGCLARKQVERSCSDPGVFIITYTAEHSHGHPTRRSSLAGTTRAKSSPPAILPPSEEPIRPNETVLSQRQTTTTEDDFVQQECMKRIAEQMLEDLEEDKVLSSDVTLNGKLRPSFDDLESLFLDQFSNTSNGEHWSFNESITSAGPS